MLCQESWCSLRGHHIIVNLSKWVIITITKDSNCCCNQWKSTSHAFLNSHTSLCSSLLSVLLSRHRVAALFLVSSSAFSGQRFSLSLNPCWVSEKNLQMQNHILEETSRKSIVAFVSFIYKTELIYKIASSYNLGFWNQLDTEPESTKIVARRWWNKALRRKLNKHLQRRGK